MWKKLRPLMIFSLFFAFVLSFIFSSGSVSAYSASANYGTFYYFTSNNPANIPGNLTQVSGIAPALNESWGHFDNQTQYGVSAIEFDFWPQNNQPLTLQGGYGVNMSISFQYYAWNSSNIVWSSSNCNGLFLRSLQFYIQGQGSTPEQITDGNSVYQSTITTSFCDVVNGWPKVTFDIFFILPETKTISYFRPEIVNFTNSLWSCGPSTAYPCDTNPNTYGSYWSGLNNLDVSIEVITDSTAVILQQQLAIQRQEQAHRQQLEEDAGNTISGADSNSQEAAQTATAFTSNYLSVFIQFRDMLLNVHSTDCRITFPQTGNMVHASGNTFFNLGTIDFCALSVPSPLLAIGSLAIFWLMLNLSIWVVRQFYETFEEMLAGGGGK